MVKLPFSLNLKSFGKKAQKNTFFTVDVGSNSVKCLAFKLDEETPNTLKLIGAGRELLEPQSVRAGNIIELEAVAEAVDNALFKAVEGLDQEMGGAIFGVGGDLCIPNVTTAKVNRGQTGEITQKEVDAVIQKLTESAYNYAQNKILKTTGSTENNLELITSSTVYSKLDNNITDELVGKTGRTMEMAYFTAYSPKYHLDSLSSLAGLLKLNVLAVTSNMYAVTQSLKRGMQNETLDAIIIDIGSSTTEVGVIFGGGLVGTKTLHVGGDQFTNTLSTSTGLAFFDAEKKKHDYTFGTLHDSELIKIENTLNEITSFWLSGMEVLFTEFNGVKTFPTDIYLTGGGSKLPLILEALETKPWTRSIPFREPPQYDKIATKDFTHVHDVTGESDQAEFVIPTALSSIYFEMMGQKND